MAGDFLTLAAVCALAIACMVARDQIRNRRRRQP